MSFAKYGVRYLRAEVVTTDIIQGAWQDIITSHIAGVSFLSMWTPPLDDESVQDFPAAWWGPLKTGAVHNENRVGRFDTFYVDVMFLDQTASDRPQVERDQAHSKMDAIARQCWLRFSELYIDNSTTFDGVTLDLQVASPTFDPVYDDGPKHLTGVRMTVTLMAEGYDECLTNYFLES